MNEHKVFEVNGRVVKLTEESLRVFAEYAEDAPNWSGQPLVGGNVGGTKEERGNLTHLKRAKLITTHSERLRINEAIETLVWLSFTEDGEELARQIGFTSLT